MLPHLRCVAVVDNPVSLLHCAGVCYLAGVPVVDWVLSLFQILYYCVSALLWAFWQLLQPAQDQRHSSLPELHQVCHRHGMVPGVQQVREGDNNAPTRVYAPLTCQVCCIIAVQAVLNVTNDACSVAAYQRSSCHSTAATPSSNHCPPAMLPVCLSAVQACSTSEVTLLVQQSLLNEVTLQFSSTIPQHVV